MCNQMFQYAFGRALSLRSGARLYLDASALNPKKHSKYALDAFCLKAEFASSDKIKSVQTPHFALRKKLWKALKIPFKYAQSHVLEPKFSYNAELARTSGSAYFDGYWQTERYFDDFAPQIRADFRLKNEDALKKHRLYADIASAESVSLHIRRGDYVKNPKYRRRLYVCGRQYFEDAMQLARAKIKNPKFFICSDDHEYVRQNFALDDNTVLIDSSNHFEDFFLMMSCKHNIISNSSFSWWPAWLNPNLQKIVIAPKRWFTDYEKADYSDVIPAAWIKIPTGNLD